MSRQFATFTLDGARYGVDVLRVQEALRAHTRTPVPLAPRGIAGLVNLRGQVVMTIDLRSRLGLAPLPGDAEPMMVVVQVDGEPISLLVDEIGDVLDVEDDQFAELTSLAAEDRRLVTGAYHLDGAVLHVLDVDAVLEI